MTPDGRVIYAGAEATYAIDAQTLRVVRRYPVGGLDVGHQPRRRHARARRATTEAFACSTSAPGACGA